MSITLRTTPYGPAAHTALADAIDRLKGDDRLCPVAVIVASNHVGIAARRALGRRRGVAAVTFLTPYRLAELLGASAVAGSGRRPISTPVLAGAVRAVLHDDPGHFAAVASHPTTERSLVRAHRALSEVPDDALRRLGATSTRTADVVRIHRAVRQRLAPRFSDEQDLVAAAIAALERGAPVLDDLGPAILFLPQRLPSSQVALLREFGRHHHLEMLVGLTGADDADEPVRHTVERIGAAWAPSDPPPSPAVADRAISVSDADEEVRHAVREVVAAARDGIALDRCAIVYGTQDPYARLVADALDGAGIDWFGASVRTADTSLLGRSLLALLALPDHHLSRRDLTAWLAAAPVHGVDNRLAPVAAWERAGRAAGVVAGVDQWTERLGRLVDDLKADIHRMSRDEENAWRVSRLEREIDHAQSLAGFVVKLAADLRPGGRAASWAGLARWCQSLMRTYLGGETRRDSWPPDEQAAATRIEAAIDRLGDLDGVDPAPSVAAFRRALELQLADDLARHGTFGSGVLVGPASTAIGVELDRVIVLGMAEGSFPPRRRDDPLLPDRIRALAAPDLPARGEALHDDHRALLAITAAAAHTTFTFPRGDLRRSAERAPSRWLLDSCEVHDGARPPGEELGRRTGEWFREVPSFVSGLRAAPFPAHDQEYDVRALLDAAEAGDDIAAHPLVGLRPELQRGVALIRGRLSADFTRFDGNLTEAVGSGRIVLPAPDDPGHVTSATRLEAWARCPHAYFVRYVLGVAAVEDPEEQYRISPLALGSLVHEVLDQWIAEVLGFDTLPPRGGPWSHEQVRRLLDIGAGAADRLRERGLVGRAVYWGRDRTVLFADLARFAELDHEQRAAASTQPIATELPFGMPDTDTPPILLSLPDGRQLQLRGAIDRVDEDPAGALTVIDYKTGSTRAYGNVDADDPAPDGAHLQLVLYTLAARAALGRPDAAARGAYWFVTRKGGFSAIGYDVTPDVEAIVLDTVARIVDGIAAGLFPAHPAVPRWRPWVDCEFCEPDGLGLAHQYADWERMAEAPELAPYLAVNGSDNE